MNLIDLEIDLLTLKIKIVQEIVYLITMTRKRSTLGLYEKDL